jgi:glycosyltransferase involved in cell wall biosynthesis
VALGNDPLVSKLNAFYPDKWSSYLSDWQQSSQAAEEVSFVGGIPHLQLANYFRGADIFVHPSVWGEPFPLTVLEAMATGLPAILTQVGGLPESIEEGRTGLLVKPDDADALASAILQLLRDEDTRTSMGQLAHQRVVERFSLEGVMEDLMQEYRQLV